MLAGLRRGWNEDSKTKLEKRVLLLVLGYVILRGVRERLESDQDLARNRWHLRFIITIWSLVYANFVEFLVPALDLPLLSLLLSDSLDLVLQEQSEPLFELFALNCLGLWSFPLGGN